MSRYVSPVEAITDGNGAPMVGAKLVFYETGTATLKTVYSDSGLSVPIANPVTAVSSGAGAIYPDIYLDGIYKVVQQDDTGTAGVADGSVLWTRDPIGDIASGNFEAWLNDATYSVPEVIYASDDNYYISLVDANQGNEPSASPAQWQLIPMKDMASRKAILDDNGNDIVIFTTTPTATNEVTIANAASGNAPSINQTGTDDVGIIIEGVTCKNGQATTIRSIISDVAGTNRAIDYRTAGVQRWSAATNSAAESGGSAGSDYVINRYGDAGALIDSPLTINRATGLCTITNLASSSVGTAIAGQVTDGIGTYAFLYNTSTVKIFNETQSGSLLQYSSTVAVEPTPRAASGTWRCMGYAPNTGRTVWLRIS